MNFCTASATGKADLRTFDRLAHVLTDISNEGYAIILVSSGAIAVGATTLRKETRPTALRCKQTAAAVDQGAHHVPA